MFLPGIPANFEHQKVLFARFCHPHLRACEKNANFDPICHPRENEDPQTPCNYWILDQVEDDIRGNCTLINRFFHRLLSEDPGIPMDPLFQVDDQRGGILLLF